MSVESSESRNIVNSRQPSDIHPHPHISVPLQYKGEIVHLAGENYTRIDAKYVHEGSLGPKIDSMVGTCPLGAPAGYVLRKLEYHLSPPSDAKEFLATYRHGDQHNGLVTLHDPARTSQSNILNATNTYAHVINNDSALSSTTQYSSQNPQRVQDGDILIATIMRVADNRPHHSNSGNFTMGLVPCVDADPLSGVMNALYIETAMTEEQVQEYIDISGGSLATNGNKLYNTFEFPNNLASKIIGNSIGGSKRVPCSGVHKNVAVVHVAESDAYSMIVNRDKREDIFKKDTVTPIMAIAVEGISTEDAPKFDVLLTTYALVGPRDDDHSHPGRNVHHSMKCFTTLFQDSPLYVQ